MHLYYLKEHIKIKSDSKVRPSFYFIIAQREFEDFLGITNVIMGSVASQVIQTYDDFIDISASYVLNVSSNTTKNNGQVHDDNLETVSLLWLDADVNTTEENRLTQLELRQIINHLKTFDDQQQCHQHILSIPVQDRVILVVSGRLGRQLVPQIHHLRQISSIYIYCMDKEGNERWAKDFTKV